MRFFRIYLLPFVIAALLVVATHAFILTQVSVESTTQVKPLAKGDRVLVVRSYFSAPIQGDIVAYTDTLSKATCLGKVAATSADSISLDSGANIARSKLIGTCVCTSFSHTDGTMRWNRCFRRIGALPKPAKQQ